MINSMLKEISRFMEKSFLQVLFNTLIISIVVILFYVIIWAHLNPYNIKRQESYWNIVRYLPVENDDTIVAINPHLCHLFEREPEFYVRIQDSNNNFEEMLRLDSKHWICDAQYQKYLFRENPDYEVIVEHNNGELEIRLRYLQ